MSTYPTYIPAADAAFAAWLGNFSTLLTIDPAAYGLDLADATDVESVTATFATAYALAIEPATRTTPTIAAKDAARASAEAVVRPLATRISGNPSVSNQAKSDIGVTIRSQTPTPIPPPTEAPELGIDYAIPLVQTLTAKVPGAAGKAKPFGSTGLQIFRAVGLAPAVDPAAAVYEGTYTKSPLKQRFAQEDQGKYVTYFARYVTRSGPEGTAQTGPWSAPLSIIVM